MQNLRFVSPCIQAKIQCIQDPSQSNVDTLNKVIRVARRHFRKKKAYLKVKIEELETNSNINNIRVLYSGINDVKKGYQPRTGVVKDEKGDLVADFHSIMAMWRNYECVQKVCALGSQKIQIKLFWNGDVVTL
jgi:predicted site-specific integrase-resolvase